MPAPLLLAAALLTPAPQVLGFGKAKRAFQRTLP